MCFFRDFSKVVIDRETGRSRGFGFISYAESSSVDECISALDGQVSRTFHVVFRLKTSFRTYKAELFE